MVFTGRLLIVLAAVVLLACAVFVLASIAVRMRQGHWLRRAGPFEVSETATGKVDHRLYGLEEIVVAQRIEIAELGALVEDADRTIANLRAAADS
jgi:hypothetical protein